MKIARDLFHAIRLDPRWLPFLVFNDEGTWVDLEKYSDNKTYLPINVGEQPYIRGFLFMKELFADKYRTPDNFVKIEPQGEEE